MGCDIHLRIERRVDGRWQNVPWMSPWRSKYDKEVEGSIAVPDCFDGRNYNLFAILANVRNGTWGERLTPISEPRGIPEDSAILNSDDYRSNSGWIGDHSFSYVTLRELQEYGWDSLYRYTAYVSDKAVEALEHDGTKPESWAGWSSRGQQVSWETTVRDAVGDWPAAIISILATLGGPDDVRLVFGFDS